MVHVAIYIHAMGYYIAQDKNDWFFSYVISGMPVISSSILFWLYTKLDQFACYLLPDYIYAGRDNPYNLTLNQTLFFYRGNHIWLYQFTYIRVNSSITMFHTFIPNNTISIFPTIYMILHAGHVTIGTDLCHFWWPVGARPMVKPKKNPITLQTFHWMKAINAGKIDYSILDY